MPSDGSQLPQRRFPAIEIKGFDYFLAKILEDFLSKGFGRL
jgi:hypothetical protein